MNPSSLSAAQTPEQIPTISEDYADIIFRYQIAPESVLEELALYHPQLVDSQYTILHIPLSENLYTVDQVGYSSVPNLFTFIDTASLESGGILAAQIQPYLNLTGKGVLLGFLDSGIDYTHPAFRSTDGRTRILRLWDQTDQNGTPPVGIGYGTEYTQEQINEALFSGDPFSVVPQYDPYGHGTAVAGIACGSPDTSAEFIGAAPDANIVFVRLKEAKQYLRDYFLIPEDAIAYQESDLMLAIRYMIDTSRRLRMPLVICISLGSNQGGHTGSTPLEDVLSAAQFNTGIYVVTGTGNEAGKGHHYLGRLPAQNTSDEIELLVDEETDGFTIEFWADAPELYSIGFTSPLGETIQPIQPRPNTSREFDFLLERSRISLTYTVVEMLSGAQLAMMRFINPATGIWRIRIVNLNYINGVFHLWLPISGLVNPSVRFYSPSLETTLVVPSCAPTVITSSTYNAYNNSLFINSGRGFTRNGLIKPDFAAPGVSLTAPAVLPRTQTPGTPAPVQSNPYTTVTGSSAATALVAGATAQIIQSGLLRPVNPRYFTVTEIKNLFLRGTNRSSIYTYPNREWGYGTMDVYGIFESFLRS